MSKKGLTTKRHTYTNDPQQPLLCKDRGPFLGIRHITSQHTLGDPKSTSGAQGPVSEESHYSHLLHGHTAFPYNRGMMKVGEVILVNIFFCCQSSNPPKGDSMPQLYLYLLGPLINNSEMSCFPISEVCSPHNPVKGPAKKRFNCYLVGYA